MKMILLVLMVISCLGCNMMMYGLGGFIGGSIVLNVVSKDDKLKCDVCEKYSLGKAEKDGSYICKDCKKAAEAS